MTCNLQSIRVTLDVIGGKWKSAILWLLTDKPYRFNEMLRTIPNITKKVLVEHLRQLENDGIISRTIYEVVPPKVEYSLTEHGESLTPVFDLLNSWGEDHNSYVSDNESN